MEMGKAEVLCGLQTGCSSSEFCKQCPELPRPGKGTKATEEGENRPRKRTEAQCMA